MSTDSSGRADFRRKIVSLEALKRMVQETRASRSPSPTIVQCHGCFDIVHPGHVRYLQFARSQGDCLIVSITPDAAISKGEQRPYIPQELRAENLAALEFVDFVVIDANATAAELLATIRPGVYVKGHEYAVSKDARFLAERRVVESYGGRVIFSSGQVVFSSSRLGEEFSLGGELELQRLASICRRHEIHGDELSRLLEDMHGARIVVLGDVVIERYVLCDASTIASESPMMSLRELDRKDFLGGAGFLAAQLAALGARPTLVTSLGDDSESHWSRRTLAAGGVEVKSVGRSPMLPIKTRFLLDDHKVFRVERGKDAPLDSVGERQAVETLMDLAERADAAIFQDGGHGMMTVGLLEELEGVFRRRVPVISGLAASSGGDLRALRNFDLLWASERRLRTSLNEFGQGLAALTYEMMQKTQAVRMIVTLGKRGLITFDRPSHDRRSPAWQDRLRSEYLPSFATRVADRLGCTEAMLAVATLALARGAGLMQACYLAEAAAALEIGRLGPSTIGLDELLHWVVHRPELGDARAEQAGPIDDRKAVTDFDHDYAIV